MLQADREFLESLPEYQERKRQDEEYQLQAKVAAAIKAAALQNGYCFNKRIVEDALMILFPGMDRDRAHGITNYVEFHNLDMMSA